MKKILKNNVNYIQFKNANIVKKVNTENILYDKFDYEFMKPNKLIKSLKNLRNIKIKILKKNKKCNRCKKKRKTLAR